MPGIPRGRRLIFVGFDSDRAGFKCFDPETRNYFSTANLYLNEDFSYRIDALRHHDQRRALLKHDLDQPVIMDDFADPNSSAVRRLYLDPDEPRPSDPFDDEAAPDTGVHRDDRAAAIEPNIKNPIDTSIC